jgi:hypothetical protein
MILLTIKITFPTVSCILSMELSKRHGSFKCLSLLIYCTDNEFGATEHVGLTVRILLPVSEFKKEQQQ